MFRKIAFVMLMTASFGAFAEDVIIRGNVASKCVIHTDKAGVYGNPTPVVLSTATEDGGVQPVVRYDVVSAGFYKAVITTPSTFSSSPALDDVVSWSGSVAVSEVSDAGMSVFTTNKRTFNNTSEFDLTVAGTVKFKPASKAEYGYGKSFPAGDYRAIVVAECIAL